MFSFKISNVKNENKFKGSYRRIFQILNSDRIFCEVYETDESKGLIGSDYFLEISQNPDSDKLEKISKLNNVIILD